MSDLTMSPQATGLDTTLADEARRVRAGIASKSGGMKAFIPRSTGRNGSINVLFGSGSVYQILVTVRDGDAMERAERYVQEFNSHAT